MKKTTTNDKKKKLSLASAKRAVKKIKVASLKEIRGGGSDSPKCRIR